MVACLAAVLSAGYARPIYALSYTELNALNNGWEHYDPDEQQCAGAPGNAVSNQQVPTGEGAVLDGHSLPAVVGGTAREEEAVRNGNQAQLAPGTSNPGAGFALAVEGLTDKDVEYYFTMRWRYATWNWRGGSDVGPEDKAWYEQAVRKVLVTNPKNESDPNDDVSVVVSIAEAGPAPWTGIQQPDELEPPSYWQGYVDGTPGEYRGRVSGLAPAAYNKLGSDDELRRRINGDTVEGADLYYQWAPDQNTEAGTTYNGAVPGAVELSALSSGTSQTCNKGSVGGSFVFYSQYDPEWINHPYGSGSGASTLGPSGCGPSALAMVVATMVDRSVSPADVADWGTANGTYIPGTGSSWNLFTNGPTNWGLKSTAIGTDINEAISALENGAYVIASGSGATPYTSGGHIIALRGVTDDGKILIGDSNTEVPPQDDPNNTKEWDVSDITQGLKGLWIIEKS